MLLSVLLTAAWAGECTYVKPVEITSIAAPAVIVLGERHGTQPDLRRAYGLVTALSRKGPVRLALEAVHREQQSVLDQHARDTVSGRDLPELLDWSEAWGFPYKPYARLVEAADRGVMVIAAGLDLGPLPEGKQVPLPPRYIDVLRPSMGGHDVPLGYEARFVQAMAWRDHAIAQRALQGWDGKGYVVILTGRGHVEGGLGVTWQAERLTDKPVHGFVLKAGEDPPCHAGDRLWK